MAEILLKSYTFRRERERTWRELDHLVGKVESRGIRSLTPEEMHRLPLLYRAGLSSLSVARSISLDRNVLDFLENLCTRAYLCVYGARGSIRTAVGTFFSSGFPSAVRAARWHLLVAALVLAVGAATGYLLTLAQPDWYYTFVPESLAQDRSPTSTAEDLRKVLYTEHDAAKQLFHVFASFLFTHNASIGILCFALGFALGIPVVLLLFGNGATLGAMAALYQAHGLSVDFWAWISVHGTTELLAVAICAAAGLMLGGALAVPGPYSRLESLARQGRVAGRIIVGAVVMFLIAGILEGYVRQLVVDPEARYLIGGTALVIWGLYFTIGGRRHRDGAGG